MTDATRETPLGHGGAGHHRSECKHGVIVSQCRCMAANKTVTIVPCPKNCDMRSVAFDSSVFDDAPKVTPPSSTEVEVIRRESMALRLLADELLASEEEGYAATAYMIAAGIDAALRTRRETEPGHRAVDGTEAYRGRLT